MKKYLSLFIVFWLWLFPVFANAWYLGSWKIDDYLTFPCNTHDPDTGVATDAASVPTYRVYEDETGTPILTGSTAKLDDANTTGFYSERIQLTAANGLEKGKSYTIYITATVDGDTGTMGHTFQMEAEVDANVVSDKTGYTASTVSDKTGYALSAAGNTAVIDEFETQSAADPTGFKVNQMEVNGTAQTANDNGADINAILTDTAVIGALGAGLTAVPWNSNWDAEVESEVDDSIGGGTGTAMTAIPWNSSWDTEVQSECDDALVNLNLDHLCKIAVDTNWATTVHLDSVIGHIADDGTAATFNRVGDSLEDLRDQGDAAWVTATGFATSGAMTTAQNDLDIITGASGVVIQDGTLVAASFGADCITSAKIADNAIAAEHIAAAAIDNATFAADVGSTAHATNIISQAARKGLDDYDPPTKAEMDTAHGLLATPAQVNAQVSDVLKTDTISELSAGAPTATPSFEDAIMLMYMDLRNANETTTSEYRIKNNAGTTIAESDLSDAAGTTTFGELRAPN